MAIICFMVTDSTKSAAKIHKNLHICKKNCNFVAKIVKSIAMILIADSGSTKVHWYLVTASGQCSDVRTDGINPLFQTCDAMRNDRRDVLLVSLNKK